MFRVANKDNIVKPHIFMVFELVIYVRIGSAGSGVMDGGSASG